MARLLPVSLAIADHAYVMETWRVTLSGSDKTLRWQTFSAPMANAWVWQNPDFEK
jgi:hypothetical protein